MCPVQSSRRRPYRTAVVDRGPHAHRTAALYGMRPRVLGTGGHPEGSRPAPGTHGHTAGARSAVGRLCCGDCRPRCRGSQDRPSLPAGGGPASGGAPPAARAKPGGAGGAMGGGAFQTASQAGGMGADRVGHGAGVPAGGRLRPTDPGHGSAAERAGRRAHPGSPTFAHGGVAGLYGGVASGWGGRVAAATAWASRAQAAAPAGTAADLMLRPGGQGPHHGWPGRGGPEARDLRWSTPFGPAVASTPTRHDALDGLHGTLGWHLAWAGRAPAAPYPVSVLASRTPPREGLARGEPRHLCDAA
jgi:hypothetical protein